MPVFVNTSKKLLAFGGIVKGFKLVPGERTKASEQQLAILRLDPCIQAYIKAGDVIDVEGVLTSPAPASPKEETPEVKALTPKSTKTFAKPTMPKPVAPLAIPAVAVVESVDDSEEP